MYGPEWLQPRQMHGILSGLQRLQAGMGTQRVVVCRSWRLLSSHTISYYAILQIDERRADRQRGRQTPT